MPTTNAKFDLTIKSYAERAQLASQIHDECARAEKGEKIDLKQTVAKLESLVGALKQDSKAITKTTPQLRKTHLAHKNDVNALTARVNALSAKATNRSIPSWVKPNVTKALVIGGVAAGLLAAYKYGMFSSPVTPPPKPPTPPLTPDEIYCQSKFTFDSKIDPSKSSEYNSVNGDYLQCLVNEQKAAALPKCGPFVSGLEACFDIQPPVPPKPPTEKPTTQPTVVPTNKPTTEPTVPPSEAPTQPPVVPTTEPTTEPTVVPTTEPTVVPTTGPTTEPTVVPTTEPTTQPTVVPTTEPTAQPTVVPTTQPTVVPAKTPTKPTAEPTVVPAKTPTKPTAEPTQVPTKTPTQPTVAPTKAPTKLKVTLFNSSKCPAWVFALPQTLSSQFGNKTALSTKSVRDMYHDCIEAIKGHLSNRKINKCTAFAASTGRNACKDMSRNATKDQFFAKVILPLRDYIVYGGNRPFSFFENKYMEKALNKTNETEISERIMDGTFRSKEVADWMADSLDYLEYVPSKAGDFISNYIHTGTGQFISKYPASSPAAFWLFGLGSNIFMSGSNLRRFGKMGLLGYLTPYIIMDGPNTLFSIGTFLNHGLYQPVVNGNWTFKGGWDKTGGPIVTIANNNLYQPVVNGNWSFNGGLEMVESPISGAGQALGRSLGNNVIGKTAQQYPKTTLVTTGVVLGNIGRFLRSVPDLIAAYGNAFKDAGYLQALKAIPAKPVLSEVGSPKKRQQKADAYNKLYATYTNAVNLANQRWKNAFWIGVGTVSAVSLVVGPWAVVGAVAVPTISAAGYAWYSYWNP